MSDVRRWACKSCNWEEDLSVEEMLELCGGSQGCVYCPLCSEYAYCKTYSKEPVDINTGDVVE